MEHISKILPRVFDQLDAKSKAAEAERRARLEAAFWRGIANASKPRGRRRTR